MMTTEQQGRVLEIIKGIDMEQALSLYMTATCHRLHDLGWEMHSAMDSTPTLTREANNRIPDILLDVAVRVTRAVKAGADSEASLMPHVCCVFVIAGVELADEMNEERNQRRAAAANN